MPRSISATAPQILAGSQLRRAGGARRVRRGLRRSAASAGASSRWACSATAGRSPRWRANRMRMTVTTSCARRAGGHRVQGPGGESQVPFGLRQRSAGQFVAGHPCGQLRIPRDHAGRERGQELVRGGAQPLEPEAEPVVREQAAGQVPVRCGNRVPDSLQREAVRRVPAGRGGVQRGQFGRRAAPQLQLQEVGEQLVIAEPGPPRIQRDDERVGLLELLQDPLAARTSGQQVGQFAVHPVQHRGPQQQPPDRLGLPLQHLGQQVLRDRALAAGELGRETVRLRMPGQRQRGQPQPRRPALGPVIQPGQRWLGQRYPGRLEQGPRLILGEAQAVRADLGELAGQPQPVQAQPEIVPGGKDEPQPRGRAHEQQLQLAQRVGRAQLVQVVDHQQDPVLQAAQIGEQPLDDRPAVQIGRGRQRPHQLRPGGGVPQRAEHRQPEPLRVALLTLHRHPRGALGQAALADPGAQQERLAAAGRRRYLGHPLCSAEQLEQPGPGDDTVSDARRPAGASIAGGGTGRTVPSVPVQLAGPTAPSLTGPPLTLRRSVSGLQE